MRRLRNLRAWLVDRAVRRGWWPGDRDYARFVVVTHYRCGSNWFLSLLRSHPRVVAHSELFFPRHIYWGSAAHSLGADEPYLMRIRERSPTEFLNRAVFRPYARHTLAVGFKLMYSQVEEELRAALLADDDLRIIHLRRSNILRILISQELARRTGAMSSTSEADSRRRLDRAGKVELSVRQCRKQFERILRFQDEWRGRAHLEFDYEDLLRDPQGAAGRAFDLLGIPRRPASSPLVRQTSRGLGELVENLEELAAAFGGTEWEWMFEGEEEGRIR
ncbi:MAG: sulfotransferase [Planctomycetota bacterium]